MARKGSEAPARGRSLRQQARGRVSRRPDPVLVVDDDIAGRRSLEWLLEGKGFKVVTAADGIEALGKLRKGLTPCLIVLDLAMQGMDGFEFRKAQLRDARLAAIPLAVYSAGGAHGRERELSGAHLLAKPFDTEALLKLVEQHCSRS